MSSEGSGADARPRSYRVIVPPHWWVIPLADEHTATQSGDALVREQFRGIDDAPLARAEVRDYLRRRVETAREAGGVELYLDRARIGGVPVPTALLISYTPPPSAMIPLETLVEILASGDGTSSVRSCEVRELPVGPAVRRVTYRAVADPASVRGEPVPSVAVEWHLPVPVGAGSLVSLSFSTNMVTLETALSELFDAIAATFEWRF